MAKKEIEQTEIEAPYELPEGWKWVTIKDCFEVTSSRRVLKEDWKDNGIPFYRTRELVKLSENGFVDNELFIEKSYYDELKEKYGVPKIGDLLISGVGTIGVPFVITTEDEFYFKDGNVIWFKNNGKVVPNYIFYLYKSNFIINQIHNMSAGTTVDTYTIINAMNTIIPLPPTLAEQQRIVNRIESMFAKLDEAKEKAQNVVDSFETRKAAILHKAFTGELTAKWRKENGVSDDSWEEKTIGECLIAISDKYDPQKDKIEGIQYIGLENIEANGGIISTGDVSSVKSIKTLFKNNDLLYGKLRPYLNKHDIVEFDGICSTDILVYRSKPEYEIKFFNYLFSQNCFIQYAIENSNGINLPRTSEKNISAYSQKIPTLPEQQEIVRILDIIIEKERIAKQAAEAVLEQIDLLKKSILARAFRGEL